MSTRRARVFFLGVACLFILRKQQSRIKGVNPDRNPNERRPYGKKEYSDTETLKEGKGKLERKPKP